MDTHGSVLIGAQRPAYWTAPDRHRDRDNDCAKCQDPDYTGGCGNQVAEEVLDWASNYWTLDDWQLWSLTEGLGVKSDRRWSATTCCEILPRQNGKGTILEVRELAGLFVLGEKEVTHTAHLFSTGIKHFKRCVEIVENNNDLMKWVKKPGGIIRSHGFEAIVLKSKPTLIFGPANTQVTKSYERMLQFIARNDRQGRGFTGNCLVFDESMFLTAEQIGAARPALRAVANHQIWIMGSAGTKDSVEEARYYERILRGDNQIFGAMWGGVKLHKPECPRDRQHGRETNDFVVNCTLHDDRDDPKVWARSNPAMGIRVEQDTFEQEITDLDFTEFNREILNVGEWPEHGEHWSIVDKDQWEFLTLSSLGTVPPIVVAVDVDEDSRTAAICAAWMSGDNKRIVVYNPQGCVQEGTDWVIPKLTALYKGEWKVAKIVVPKDGPAAGLGDSIELKFRDRVIRPGPSDQAAALAFFTQQVNANVIGHASRAKNGAMYEALGTAEVRIVGDAGKTVKRKDATVPVSPASTAILSAWAFNKFRKNYNLANSIA